MSPNKCENCSISLFLFSAASSDKQSHKVYYRPRLWMGVENNNLFPFSTFFTNSNRFSLKRNITSSRKRPDKLASYSTKMGRHLFPPHGALVITVKLFSTTNVFILDIRHGSFFCVRKGAILALQPVVINTDVYLIAEYLPIVAS